MNKISKLLSLLSAPVLVSTFCTSCGKNSVTITINGGIGTYKDASFIKSFSAKKGTRLDDCRFDAPILNYYSIEYDWDEDASKTVLYYTTEDGKVYNNAPIKSDTVLYAHYYESFSKEKQITKETITRVYQMVHEFRPEWTHIGEVYNQATSKIDSSTTIYQLCTYKYCYDSIIRALGGITPEHAPSVINVCNHFLDKVDDVRDNQSPISIAKSIVGFCAAATLKGDDEEWLSGSKTLIDIQLKYIDKIDPNCTSYYGVPFDAIVRGYAQQPLLMDLDDSLELFCDAYTQIHDISEGIGLARPIIGISAMGVSRPALISKCNELYAQIVQDILNN